MEAAEKGAVVGSDVVRGGLTRHDQNDILDRNKIWGKNVSFCSITAIQIVKQKREKLSERQTSPATADQLENLKWGVFLKSGSQPFSVRKYFSPPLTQKDMAPGHDFSNFRLCRLSPEQVCSYSDVLPPTTL
jgi:hypothetical protein